MRILILLVCSLFTIIAHSATLDQLGSQISQAWRKSGKAILALGQASHQDPSSLDLLKNVVLKEAFDIGFLAVEIHPDQKAEVERLVREINYARKRDGRFPLRLIMLDLQQTKWFSSGQPYTVGLNAKDINRQRGIVFARAGFALPYLSGLPTLQGTGINMSLDFTSAQDIFSSNPDVLRIYLNTRWTTSERLSALFQYIQSHFTLATTLRVAPGTLLATRNDQFRAVEVLADDNGPTAVSKHFHYWAELEGLRCEDELDPL